MSRTLRNAILAALMTFAAAPMLSGCVMVDRHHGGYHDHWRH